MPLRGNPLAECLRTLLELQLLQLVVSTQVSTICQGHIKNTQNYWKINWGTNHSKAIFFLQVVWVPSIRQFPIMSFRQRSGNSAKSSSVASARPNHGLNCIDHAVEISMVLRPDTHMGRYILVQSESYILVHFGTFWYILVHSDTFWYIGIWLHMVVYDGIWR